MAADGLPKINAGVKVEITNRGNGDDDFNTLLRSISCSSVNSNKDRGGGCAGLVHQVDSDD